MKIYLNEIKSYLTIAMIECMNIVNEDHLPLFIHKIDLIYDLRRPQSKCGDKDGPRLFNG